MNKKMKEQQDQVLKYTAALAAKVAENLIERTGLDWIVTPNACYLDWSLDFRCPGATVDCIQVSDGLFAGVRGILTAASVHADVYIQNWIVYRITDQVLSFCLTKCLHKCCHKDPDSIWYPAKTLEPIYAEKQAQ